MSQDLHEPEHERSSKALKDTRSLLFYLLSLIFTSTLYCQTGSAAGFEFPESGSGALIRGGAAVSGITDATATFLNPGVLSRLSGLRLSYNHSLIWSQVSFTRSPTQIPDLYNYDADENTQRGDGTGLGSNQETFFPINGLLAMSYQLDSGLTLGLSAHGPHGGGSSRYPIQGGQRYMMTQLDAVLAYIGGSLAYGGEHWGIGTTLQLATMPMMKYRLVVDGELDPNTLNPTLSANDIEAELDVSDPAAFTALLGAWFRPVPSFEIAVSGRVLPVRFEPKGGVNIYNTPNQTRFADELLVIEDGSASFKFTLPQTARIGFRYRGLSKSSSTEESHVGLDELFDLELALVYEAWSVMNKLDVQLQGKVVALNNRELNDVTIEKRWHDTFSVRLGGSYRILPQLKISGGGFFEQGASPKQYTHIDFPSLDRFGVSTGLSYQLIPQLELVVGYLHIFRSEVTVSELEAKVFQQRPIAPCNDGMCGSNEAGQPYSGIPVNAGTHSAQFQSFTLGLNAYF